MTVPTRIFTEVTLAEDEILRSQDAADEGLSMVLAGFILSGILTASLQREGDEGFPA